VSKQITPSLRVSPHGHAEVPSSDRHFDVVIVGGGSAGIATAASLLKRTRTLKIAIIEPASEHFYQPGWTMVGAGIFRPESTRCAMADVMPREAIWIQQSASSFRPEQNEVVLDDGSRIAYRTLVAAPGIKLDWSRVEGLSATLGKNGVTSNYRYDLAPYTWELVRNLDSGTALFTQPPMPIKCAGAPQKAMYLSCDTWQQRAVLKNINVEFHNAGGVLFGVAAYVPALMEYVTKYGIDLCFNSNLVAVDGSARTATFEQKSEGGQIKRFDRQFDLLHVVPTQVAPDFVRSSPLANETGFIDVDHATLRHKQFENVFALGDACSAPNAKTIAAARKQAPIVAVNVLATLEGQPLLPAYDGYGACPLTVERGRIVLAEFGYGGKLLPTLPTWMIDGTRPSRAAWFLKSRILPSIYWHGMLKGQEWLVTPTTRTTIQTGPTA
jgi:sulfide:quinone oxidoreductase